MTLLLLLPLVGCTSKGSDDTSPTADADTDTDSDTDTDADSDADTDTDTDVDTGDIVLPASPLPIDITLGGSATGVAHFDQIVCSYPPNHQLQLTYSDSTNSYTWTMRAFIRETFTGAATYSTNVQVQLLENFSGGRYYASNSADGAAVSVTVDGFGNNGAYGTLTTAALTGDSGDVTLAPQPIPFWCDVIDS